MFKLIFTIMGKSIHFISDYTLNSAFNRTVRQGKLHLPSIPNIRRTELFPFVSTFKMLFYSWFKTKKVKTKLIFKKKRILSEALAREKVTSIGCVQFFVTPRTIESMAFSRPEYWSGQLFPSPGDLPNPWIETRSPVLQADSLPAEPQGKPQLSWKEKSEGRGQIVYLQPWTTRWDRDPVSPFFTK